MTKKEITEKIKRNICNKFDVPNNIISGDSTFKSIGVDSLDAVEIIVDTETEFNINVPDNKLLMLQSVGTLVDYIDESLNKKQRKKSVKHFISE
jgi:acyl carrier protein